MQGGRLVCVSIADVLLKLFLDGMLDCVVLDY